MQPPLARRQEEGRKLGQSCYGADPGTSSPDCKVVLTEIPATARNLVDCWLAVMTRDASETIELRAVRPASPADLFNTSRAVSAAYYADINLR